MCMPFDALNEYRPIQQYTVRLIFIIDTLQQSHAFLSIRAHLNFKSKLISFLTYFIIAFSYELMAAEIRHQNGVYRCVDVTVCHVAQLQIPRVETFKFSQPLTADERNKQMFF